jgi:hypothetical protein
MTNAQRFEDVTGAERWFISYMKEGGYIRAWYRPRKEETRIDQVNIPVARVSKQSLIALNVWDTLSEDIQQKIEGKAVPVVENVVKVDNVIEEDIAEPVDTVVDTGPKRRGRKAVAELVGVPRVITCKCGVETHVNPRQVLEQATEAGQTVLQWVDGYKCRKCRKA